METFADGMNPPKPPIHLLTLENAEERLHPYKMLLDECLQGGVDAWTTHYAHRHCILDARARAAIIFCEIVALAQQKFNGLEDVKFERRRNSFLLYIGSDIVIRFKKITKTGRCRSINTRQQMLFELQMALPGMETGTLLHAGYALNDLQTAIAEKLVVCQFKNHVLWTLKLSTPSGGVVEVMPTPLQEPPKGPRWELKPEAEKQSKKQTAKGKANTAGKE